MKIPLSKGLFAIVDKSDYELLSQFKWSALNGASTTYACRCKQKNGVITYLLMHRVILDTTEYVDHINGNGLDNRRSNLRIATHSQNLYNRGPQKNNKSGYKGVSWDASRSKWKAQIKAEGTIVCIGRFNTKEEAAAAYDIEAHRLHKEFAFLNLG